MAVFTVAAMTAIGGSAVAWASDAAPQAAALLQAAAAPRAFPGAEGAGANAKGGRGGDVYYVTTLADSGAGSLRTGISGTPAGGRTILFKVSGTIALASALKIDKSNLTIAGQSAPGDGIAIRNYTIDVTGSAHDVILRHLRLRTGASDARDAMWISSANNIIVDHLSTSWGSDEVLSASRDVQNLTVQNTLIYEALNRADHAFGSIIDSQHKTTYSYHHNLWANNISRNPRPGTSAPDAGFTLDLRDNVFHNWGYAAGYSGADDGPIDINYVNNYLTAGPSSTTTCAMDSGGSLGLYQSGNKLDVNKNGKVDGTDTGSGMFCGSFRAKSTTPYSAPAVTTESAESAYLRVLAQGGAMPWRRDAVDKREVNTVRTQTGKIINEVSDVGGWPTLNSQPAPADADSDGIPDFWEQAMGLNPSNAADRNNTDSSGYTMLENYLNWLSDGHAVADRNGSVDVNLQTLNGGLDNLKFTMASGSNGAVTLLGDGHTARFTPAANHSGLANFTYGVTDSATGFGFGPVSVGVLVTGTGTGTPSPSPSTSQSPSPSPSASQSPSPSPSGSPAGACGASYRTVSTWSGGWQGEVTVKAGSSAINGWTVKWSLSSGQSITQLWGGKLSASGSAVSVGNESYNGSLPASGTTTFGFIGSGTPSSPSPTCTSP